MIEKFPIKVLFLAEELRLGGAETYFSTLEERLDRSKVHFHLMAVSKSKKLADQLRYPDQFDEYGFSPASRISKIVEYCRKHEPKIIHANSLQLAICAALARKISGVDCNIIYTKHNVTRLEAVSSKAFSRFVNQSIDCLLTICQSDARYFENHGVKREKIAIINNGVDLDSFLFFPHLLQKTDESDAPHIGILARLSPEKRHDLFLEISRRLVEKHPNSIFTIAGDGPQKELVEEKIAALSLTGSVRMLGAVKAPEYLKHVDYLLLVSDREVLPMAVLEGMAVGSLVIARDVGGVSDAVKDSTGLLVSSDRPEDYVDAIEGAMCSQQGERIRLARQMVEEHFSLEASIRQHEELYKRFSDN